MKRTAVLHWHTSSVGGINTTLQSYKRVAERRGDVFDILAADPQRTKKPERFSIPKRVRGGDSFINIDGHAPYHEANLRQTVEFLAQNYDTVVTSFLCPHPTKAYGAEPKFLALLDELGNRGVQIIGYVHDAYWDSYREWGLDTAKRCERIVVAQPAYIPAELVETGVDIVRGYLPFEELVKEPKVNRYAKKIVWTAQWKNIKGCYEFFEQVPYLLKCGFSVDMFNNGIEYYYIRRDDANWKKFVADHFASPTGFLPDKAQFYGCVSEADIPGVLAGAGFMCDFQGYGKPKYAAYTNGSYNHTMIEALYYGCVPVVHSNATKRLPAELVVAVDDLRDYPAAILDYGADRPKRRKAAREYVLQNHSAEKLYAKMLRGC